MSTAVPVAAHGTDLMVASPTTHPLILVPAATTPHLGSIALDLTPLTAALQKVQALETWLGQELIEREDATRVALTALLSAQHMALIETSQVGNHGASAPMGETSSAAWTNHTLNLPDLR